MTNDEMRAMSDGLRQRSEKGSEIISALKHFFQKGPLAHHFKIRNEKPYSLNVSYYGLNLAFLIEVEISPDGQQESFIRVSLASTDDAPDDLLLEWDFDVLGNIDGRWAAQDFADPFILAVFSQLRKRKPLVLRPE